MSNATPSSLPTPYTGRRGWRLNGEVLRKPRAYLDSLSLDEATLAQVRALRPGEEITLTDATGATVELAAAWTDGPRCPDCGGRNSGDNGMDGEELEKKCFDCGHVWGPGTLV